MTDRFDDTSKKELDEFFRKIDEQEDTVDPGRLTEHMTPDSFVTVHETVKMDVLELLREAPSGSILQSLTSTTFNPWQYTVYYTAVGEALREYIKTTRRKIALVCLDPEGMYVSGRFLTGSRAMMQMLAQEFGSRIATERLVIADMHQEERRICYEGPAKLDGYHCIVVSDFTEEDTLYMEASMELVQELGAKQVLGIPMVIWDMNHMASQLQEQVNQIMKKAMESMDKGSKTDDRPKGPLN